MAPEQLLQRRVGLGTDGPLRARAGAVRASRRTTHLQPRGVGASPAAAVDHRRRGGSAARTRGDAGAVARSGGSPIVGRRHGGAARGESARPAPPRAGRFWMVAAAIASLVAIVAVVSPFLAGRGGGTIDRTGHDRARRLHEHDRRAGVRRRAESRPRRRAGAVPVHQGISRRSGAGRAAPDEPADRSAAGSIRRPRSRAARTAESVAGRVDCQPRPQLRDRDRGRQCAERRRRWRANKWR